MGLADIRAHRTRAVVRRLDAATLDALHELEAALEADVRAELRQQGVSDSEDSVFARAQGNFIRL